RRSWNSNAKPTNQNPSQGIRLPADRPVGARDRRYGEAYRRGGPRPGASTDAQAALRPAALAAHRQGVARPAGNPHAPEADGHHRSDGQDRRRTYEAGSAGWRRRRDQGSVARTTRAVLAN